MSGIFVDESDSFEITAFYTDKKGKLEVVGEKKEGSNSLTITFRYPDFNLSQKIIASCMDSVEAGGNINVLKMRTNLIYFLAEKWDAKDKSGKNVELNGENIGKMKNEVISFFIQKVQDKVGNDIFAI